VLASHGVVVDPIRGVAEEVARTHAMLSKQRTGLGRVRPRHEA
jgi:hypothetical protein